MKNKTLTAVVWKESVGYVSKCPELGVASCGDTADQALEMLKEAVDLYLHHAKQMKIWNSIEEVIDSTEKITAPFEVAVP